MMKSMYLINTLGRDSVALTGIIIADNPSLGMTGQFYLELRWQA